MNVGNDSLGTCSVMPANGLNSILWLMPTSSSNGAVSPMIRATPSMMPVTMPAMAVGSTTRRMVRHFGTPSAYDASRSSFGTSFSTSALDRPIAG